jgi:hypothetical protein
MALINRPENYSSTKVSIMKTVIYLIIILSSAACLSCESDPEIPEPIITFNKKIDFASQLSFWNQASILSDRTKLKSVKLSTAGVSRAKYLEKFEIQLSFRQEDGDPGYTYSFEQGIFALHGEEGHALYGTFIAQIQESDMSIEMILSIEGGEGYYAEAGGHIMVKGGVDSIHPQLLILEFAGKITRP